MNINVLLKKYRPGDVLDPSFVQFAHQYFYLDNLTLRLIDLDNNGNYVLDLAKEIKPNESRDSYSIKLKPLKYSNGKLITAYDVVRSFKRVILVGSPHAKAREIFKGAKDLSSLDDEIVGLKVINDHEFVINLTRPVKELYYFLYLVDFSILPAELVKKKKIYFEDWEKIVSGPYLLKYDERLEQPKFIKNPFFNFNNVNAPDVVDIVNGNSLEDLKVMIKKSKIDYGLLNFKEFLDSMGALQGNQDYTLYGDQIDNIAYLVLNIKSDKFNNQKIRNAIYKKIYQNFQLNTSALYSLKAYQYFLPGAKGFVREEYVKNYISKLDSVDLSSISPLEIKTYKTMTKYLPENLEEKISSSLGIPVKISYEVDPKDRSKLYTERNFDAFITISSMSLKVIGETLNYVYSKNGAPFLDPSGNIQKNLNQYMKQQGQDDSENLINSILKQMITDSECIPLYYHVSPIFYKTRLFEKSDLNYQESLQFKRLSLK